jgi:hypothetical protein
MLLLRTVETPLHSLPRDRRNNRNYNHCYDRGNRTQTAAHCPGKVKTSADTWIRGTTTQEKPHRLLKPQTTPVARNVGGGALFGEHQHTIRTPLLGDRKLQNIRKIFRAGCVNVTRILILKIQSKGTDTNRLHRICNGNWANQRH